MPVIHKKIKSPIGTLTLIADESALLAVLWPGEDASRVKTELGVVSKESLVFDKAEMQLEEFFSGSRKHFDLPLRMIGTPFQIKVWKALQKIPFGQTRSYSDLARSIGSPQSCRAVGAANGKNPLSIVVPCHRVIGKNGSLTGFAGGLEAKRYLIERESQSL